MTITIIVDKDLEDLIPSFLANRDEDIVMLKQSLEQENYEQIRIIGHSMKGFGSGYGFDYISEAGMILEKAAKAEDSKVITETIAQLESYLADIHITFE